MMRKTGHNDQYDEDNEDAFNCLPMRQTRKVHKITYKIYYKRNAWLGE